LRLSLLILTFLLSACASAALTTAERRQGDFTKVAFIGDTGTGFGFGRVLDLIRAEKADLVIVLGDTDYGSTERGWDQMVRDKLGDEAAIVVFGNHDYKDSHAPKIAELGLKRLEKNPDITCKGKYGEQMTCSYRGVHFVLSSIPYGNIPRAETRRVHRQKPKGHAGRPLAHLRLARQSKRHATWEQSRRGRMERV
jgi:hypothetical protein